MLVPALILICFALTRWPGLMPMNFSAAYALAFCSGVYPRRLPIWAVLGTIAITDVLKNSLYYDLPPLNIHSLVNLVLFAGLHGMGRLFHRRAPLLRLSLGGLAGALVFYVVSNTFSWLTNPEYSRTLAGWIQSLTIGTPGWPQSWTFFQNTLLSGGLFTGLLAGLMQGSEESQAETTENAEDEIPAENGDPAANAVEES